MVHVFPSSPSKIPISPGSAFVTQKKNFLTRCSVLRNSSKQALPTQRYILPLSTSVRLFPQFRVVYGTQFHLKPSIVSATGTDIAVGEVDSPAGENDSSEATGTPPEAVDTNEESSVQEDSGPAATQSKRSRPVRKSEMPPVKNEELTPGATFTGKVRSIQPFGAFVDFGAFTDGLVHVSQLSDSFVKDVNNVVSVGQEVTVRLVEANMETGRISLTMRESADSSGGGEKSRTPRKSNQRSNQRRDEGKKTSKFVKGQDLQGTVKNLTRSGAFISLPEGEEGFLPASEEADEGLGNIMGGSSLQVGDEVNVRVLRLNRGQVTLTMKKEEDAAEFDSVFSQGVVHTATNPFVLAFQSNSDISTFLDERTKDEKAARNLEEETSEVKASATVIEDTLTEATEIDEVTESTFTADTEDRGTEDAVKNKEEEAEVSSELLEPVGSSAAVDEIPETPGDAVNDSGDLDRPGSLIGEEVPELQYEDLTAKGAVQNEILDEEKEVFSTTQVDQEVPDENPDDVMTKDEKETETPENKEVSSTTQDEQETTSSTLSSIGQIDVSSIPESPPKGAISPALVKQLREETGAGMMDCKKALSETGGDIIKAQEYLRTKGLASAEKKASRATAEGRIGAYIHDSRIGVLVEVNCETDFVSRGEIFKELVDDLAMQVAACPQVQYLAPEDVPQDILDKERAIEMQKEDLLSKPEQIRSKIVDGRIRKRIEELALLEQPYIKNDKVVIRDWVKQTIATIGENIKVKRFIRFNLGEGLEKKSQDFAAEVAAQTAAKPISTPPKEQSQVADSQEAVEKAPKAAVSAALVKQLREETGAGMMDCKKALSETGGDLEKAQDYLRKKGLAAADKKSSRIAAEGRIGSYIHDSRIGVLVEVNCETDFVGRSEKFKELVDDLAMQVVACPQVQYVSVEDIPESIINKEKELEMQREDLQSKPENIREKIVEGRVSKRLGELALLEQPFIKDDSILLKDFVKQTVAAIGENIKVRRFIRFTLGESSEEQVPNETSVESQ